MSEKPIMVFKKGFNYSQDGPGNRLVYHLLGCNMKCPWCSNPEGMDKKYTLNPSVYTIEEMLTEIISCKRLFFDGGGVTFTGGEIGLQIEPLEKLFRLLKQESINIAIESNASNLSLKNVIQYVDYIIYDLKHYDEKIHLFYTGVSTLNIKANIVYALEKSKVLVRIPLINGFNASATDVEGFIAFFNTVNLENLSVELLRYHEYGKVKWLKQNREYTVRNGFVSDEVFVLFKENFIKNNIKIVNT